MALGLWHNLERCWHVWKRSHSVKDHTKSTSLPIRPLCFQAKVSEVTWNAIAQVFLRRWQAVGEARGGSDGCFRTMPTFNQVGMACLKPLCSSKCKLVLRMRLIGLKLSGAMAVGLDTSQKLDLVVKRLHDLGAPKAGILNMAKDQNITA